MTDNSLLLKERISFLADRQSQQIVLLKEQVHITFESLKPINFLKDTIIDFTSQSDLKENIFDGISISLVSRLIFKFLDLFFANSNCSAISFILLGSAAIDNGSY